MTILQSILVLGPTGTVGQAILEELAAHKDQFSRIAAFNNTSRPGSAEKDAGLAALKEKGVEIVSGTFADTAAFAGFDAVVMALANPANHLQPQIIDTALAAGVRHFYPSEFGGDITVGDNWHQRYYRDKVLTPEHLMRRAAEFDGLGWSYITVGRFTEWAPISYFGIDNAHHTATVYGTEEGRQSLIGIPESVRHLSPIPFLVPPLPFRRKRR